MHCTKVFNFGFHIPYSWVDKSSSWKMHVLSSFILCIILHVSPSLLNVESMLIGIYLHGIVCYCGDFFSYFPTNSTQSQISDILKILGKSWNSKFKDGTGLQLYSKWYTNIWRNKSFYILLWRVSPRFMCDALLCDI